MGRTSDSRERIVRASARLFLSRSYGAVSVDELCAAAEVRKGSFYHFFPSKAELAKAVIDLHTDALVARLRANSGSGPAQRLRGVADAVGAIQSRFEEKFGRIVGCPFGNLAAELSTVDEGLRDRLASAFGRWEREFAELCHRAREAGALRDGVDPDRLAHSMLALAQGQILLAKVGGLSSASVSQALRDLIDVHLREGAV
ncbi:TetR/AcrR family transcriptional repressor of nem operon [Saccharomonospora amisosensis]|uniref:TetR/AcrR family transcriptional repressor of nem operon n=1 Tax=Saccharomonospora amisosensis TaxID=1128677 RepID=A0A7X5URQ5_9PSEU|nr:TetR/AcrR family transcriptional regulator [Saccharomonospora amisosensis]NIJ12965.1 TetR/AcrR family transcriptional repressor of nem operon [Saccharomonospora amisosensis]